MNSQLLLQMLLVSTVVVLSAIGYLKLRGSPLSGMEKLEKVLTGFLGAFFVMGGSVKFFEPFTSIFAQQIALSELPFPTLSKWAGQLGEISVGLVLLALLVLGKKIPQATADGLVYLSSLAITVIMGVAVYVHLHPNVPAEVLPFESKPPTLTLVIMLLAIINAYLHWRNRQSTHHAS